MHSKENKTQHCPGGGSRECFQDARKLNSSAKCFNIFVAHCGLIGSFIYGIEVMFVLVACKFLILMSFWRNAMSKLKYD